MISFKQTRDNLSSFYDDVTMPGLWQFNHIKTLRKIDLYYNGKFQSGDTDSTGFKKYFYNISKPACDIATKFVDLDTKNIIVNSEHPGDELKVWVMQRDLRQWLKNQKVGELLNEIAFDYPKYGTVVIKKGKNNEWKKVNLVNLRMDTTAPCLQESGFVYELLRMTRRELREMQEWDQEVIEQLLARCNDTHLLIYACYDYNPDKGKQWLYSVRAEFLTADGQGGARTPESMINNQSSYLPGYILYEEEVDEMPYRELHWEKIPGRWLGQGFVEYLFDNQVRTNEVVNVRAKGLYFTSLKIYQTRDEIVQRNLLTDAENGDIIRVQSEITPVSVEERNLSYFSEEENRWDKNTQDKTFSYDIVRGDTMPSGTTLGATQIAAGMVASYFELKRENFGLFFKDVVLEDVIPQFVKQSKKEHLVKFLNSDTEIDRLYEAITEAEVRRQVLDYAMRNGVIPDRAVIEQERANLAQKVRKVKDYFLNVLEGFYQDVKYSIDVLITNEQLDTGARAQTLQVLMQMIAANPAIIQDPTLRVVLFKLLELTGLSPVDLGLLQNKVEAAQQSPLGQQMMQQQMGGGQPMPSAPTQSGAMMAPAASAVWN